VDNQLPLIDDIEWAKKALTRSQGEQPYTEKQIDEMEAGFALDMLVTTALNAPNVFPYSQDNCLTHKLLFDIQVQGKQYSLESASSTGLVTCWIWYIVSGVEHEISATDMNINVAICKAIVKDWLGFNAIS